MIISNFDVRVRPQRKKPTARGQRTPKTGRNTRKTPFRRDDVRRVQSDEPSGES